MVQEKWFENSGSRKVVWDKWLTRKQGGFILQTTFFFWFEKNGWPEKKIRVCRTTFLEPLFYSFLEKWLQIKCSTALFQNERKRNDVEVSGLVYHTHTDLVFVQNCNLLLAVAWKLLYYYYTVAKCKNLIQKWWGIWNKVANLRSDTFDKANFSKGLTKLAVILDYKGPGCFA